MKYDNNIFLSDMEQEAITRITKFAKLAKSMNMKIKYKMVFFVYY